MTIRTHEDGEVIGQYSVLDVLGHGAMGLVYRAHDPRLDREVALKVVHPGRVAQDATKARARLVSEARALARVSHPNVLAVYDVGVHDGLVFVALELVDGIDLAQWLRRAKRPWRDVVAVFVEAAAGLAAVHAAGLVHRDIKPANILVENASRGRAFGRVLVADFGIARTSVDPPALTVPGDARVDTLDPDASLTEEGRVVGTPAYMAPEQHLGLDVGPAADQYALGVALHEALYGKRPFGGDAQAMFRAKTKPPDEPPPSDVPAWLWTIVRRGLEPSPTDRFESIADLGAALRGGPRRWRWRLVVPAAALVLVGGTVGLSLLPERPCSGVQAQVDAVWNADRRRAIERAFEASDRPYAARTWEQASQRLDAYARALAASHRDACEATRVRHEQSEALFDRRMACLEGRRQRFAQSLAVLGDADAHAVDRTDALVSALEPVAACDDVAALEAGVPPPSPAEREVVMQLRATIADADALLAVGRYDDADAKADASLARARAIAYAPALVEALTVAGDCHERVGRFDDAVAALDEAIAVGLQIGHDEVLARAIVVRTWMAGEHARDLEAAEKWAALGRARLQRIGGPARLSLQLENAIGAAYSNAGRYDEALHAYDRALALAGDDPELAMAAAAVRSNIGNVWRLLGDVERARASYEHAAAAVRERLGEDHPEVARTEGRVAQLLDLQGRHREAIEGLRRALASLERTQASPGDVAGALLDLAAALRGAGVDEEANATYGRAVELLAGSGDHYGLAHALVAYGQLCVEQAIYDAAEAHFRRALELFERMGSDDANVGMALIGLGDVRVAQSKAEEALSLYRRAEAGEGGRPDARVSARAAASIALVHHAARRFDEAVAALDRHDALLVDAPYLRQDDRWGAAVVRVRVMVDAGRAGEAHAAVDALEGVLGEMGSVGGSRWLGEGELVLGRARIARGEADAGCDAIERALDRLDASREPELVAAARAAQQVCDDAQPR